jgi:TetR/AcrR family transcriptional repressor of nem operon
MARPKEFERERVLQQAMHIFWIKGYEGTSIPELLQVMGISRSSLYETFGNKQALFIETLQLYKSNGEHKRNLLRKASSAKTCLRDYFAQHITDSINEMLPGGCFITNTAISLDLCDEQVRQLVKERFDSLEQEFYLLLKSGRQYGEISPDKDIRKLARLFIGLNHSIGVMARVNKDRKVLDDMVDAALSLI